MTTLVEQFEKHGFILEISEERLVARCDRVAPRARLGYKNEFHYKFQSTERMYEYISGFIAGHLEAKEMREKRKEEAKVRAAEMSAKVKVGDIFVDSWGYEQTNVDFYQVVAKPSPKTVIVREIACETVEGSEGMMSRDVRAVPNAFIGEEMKKRIDNYGGFKTSSFSCARPTSADRKHYNSWYY
jgi:hypothetical protein